MNSHTPEPKPQDSPQTPPGVVCSDIVRRYRDALEQIAALSNVTEVRGPLEDIGVPDHMIKEGGWVPIHPRLKDGLRYAAKIAKAALDASPNSEICRDAAT